MFLAIPTTELRILQALNLELGSRAMLHFSRTPQLPGWRG